MPISRIEYNDLLRVDTIFREIDDRISDLRPFWKNFAAPLVAGEIAEVFLSEGRGEWDPLSEPYATYKAETHPGKTILRRDDTYIQAATSAAHPGNIFESTPTEMTWGVDEGWFESRFGYDYPAAHEEGRGRLPQRQVFGLLTATGRLDENLGRLGENWLREEIAEIERVFG